MIERDEKLILNKINGIHFKKTLYLNEFLNKVINNIEQKNIYRKLLYQNLKKNYVFLLFNVL